MVSTNISPQMSYSHASTMSTISLTMLGKAMDTVEQNANAMTEMMKSTAVKPNDGIDSTFDVSI